MKLKILKNVLHELETILKRDKRNINDLQRQNQKELIDFESLFFLKFEYEGINIDQNVFKI